MSTPGLALMKLPPLSSDQSGLTVNQAVSGVCRGSRRKTPGPDFGCEMKTKRRMLHLKELEATPKHIDKSLAVCLASHSELPLGSRMN